MTTLVELVYSQKIKTCCKFAAFLSPPFTINLSHLNLIEPTCLCKLLSTVDPALGDYQATFGTVDTALG